MLHVEHRGRSLLATCGFVAEHRPIHRDHVLRARARAVGLVRQERGNVAQPGSHRASIARLSTNERAHSRHALWTLFAASTAIGLSTETSLAAVNKSITASPRSPASWTAVPDAPRGAWSSSSIIDRYTVTTLLHVTRTTARIECMLHVERPTAPQGCHRDVHGVDDGVTNARDIQDQQRRMNREHRP